MKHGGLHAYEVLSRVARVREVRASHALAEASAHEQERRTCHAEIAAACDVVTAASRLNTADSSSLDMARYDMLSALDAMLAEKLHTASEALTSAQKECQDRAAATVVAKRYREQMEEQVKQISDAIDQKCSAGMQEEAIELWVGNKTS
jgi:hypothetical protein